MSDADWQEFKRKLVSLWPGKLNEDQLREWKRAVINRSGLDAMDALSRYFAEPNSKPGDGGAPSIKAFNRKFYGLREDKRHEPDAERKTPTRAEMCRRELAAHEPAIQSATDGEVLCEYQQQVFKNAIRTYGPDAPSTKAHFRHWQREVRRVGEQPMEYERDYWAVQYEQMVSRRGTDEASGEEKRAAFARIRESIRKVGGGNDDEAGDVGGVGGRPGDSMHADRGGAVRAGGLPGAGGADRQDEASRGLRHAGAAGPHHEATAGASG